MVKIIKTLCAFLFAVAVCVFGFVAYGTNIIPDEIVVFGNQNIETDKIFKAEKVEKNRNGEKSAAGSSENYTVNISLLNIIPIKSARVSVSQRHYVLPGGEIFGLKLYSNGVMVVDTGDVITHSGAVNPARQAGLKTGDIILSIDGVRVNSSQEVSTLFGEASGRELTLSVMRNNELIELKLTPVISEADGCYKVGIWIRDSAAGIGTITYYDKSTGIFGSLGHAVCDIDTGEVIPILNGEAVKAKITGCYKGKSGVAGELCGVFSAGTIGNILINGSSGVYGVADLARLNNRKPIPVATSTEVTVGKAQIISTVDENGAQYYDIEITRIFKDSDTVRNMSVKVTDPRLIEKTGGIVQGMSGSPIIQNGMLVGAITHVFINDSLQGYAIFADKMLSVSDKLYDELYDEAS